MGGLTTAEPGITLAFSQAHEFEVICDFAPFFRCCQQGPARWIVWRNVCPECGYTTPPRLICDLCKDHLLLADSAVMCNGQGGKCQYAFAPAREIVKRIEPFEKRGAA